MGSKSIMQVLSQLSQRVQYLTELGMLDNNRNFYEVFGYKRKPTLEDYYGKYKRDHVAGKIVDLPATSTWRAKPVVYEDEDPEKQTEFEEAWEMLVKRLRLWNKIERADRLAGLGQFSILLIGTNSGDLQKPLNRVRNGGDGVLFLSPFMQRNVQIDAMMENVMDSRYGKPEMYQVQLQQLATSAVPKNLVMPKILVHHSRVIHIAEGLEEDDVYGTPRLERVYNLFDDLMKIVGGSAEMFWLIANRGMQVDVDAESMLSPDDEKNLEAEIQEYMNNLRRFIRTKGVTVTPLGGDSIDSSNPFQVIMNLVCGAVGIPQRILMGSERGELASSQDRSNWAERIKERQDTFAEPMILRPLVDRLIEIGALPEPKEPYKVKWPDLFAISDNERSNIAMRVVRTLFDASKAFELRNDLVLPSEIRQLVGLPSELPSGKRAEMPREESMNGTSLPRDANTKNSSPRTPKRNTE